MFNFVILAVIKSASIKRIEKDFFFKCTMNMKFTALRKRAFHDLTYLSVYIEY